MVADWKHRVPKSEDLTCRPDYLQQLQKEHRVSFPALTVVLSTHKCWQIACVATCFVSGLCLNCLMLQSEQGAERKKQLAAGAIG